MVRARNGTWARGDRWQTCTPDPIPLQPALPAYSPQKYTSYRSGKGLKRPIGHLVPLPLGIVLIVAPSHHWMKYVLLWHG